MTTYKYLALKEDGHKVSGKMQATDETDLQNRLKKENLYLDSVKIVGATISAKKIRADRLSDFANNLGTLIGAGVTLVRALRIICDDETIRDKEIKIYSDILKDVRAGMSLSDSMESKGSAFPPMMINMFRSAEASGTLEATAKQMGIYYDKEYRLSKKIKSSMVYPKILCFMMVVVLFIIMGYVVPQFKDLFATMPELPVTTRILLAIGDFVENKWYVIILAAVIAFMIIKILASVPAVKHAADRVKISIPKIGNLLKIIYTARFGRTLASLYNAGIPIIQCLEISKDTIGNKYIESQFPEAIKNVQAGVSLSEALSKIDGFTKKMISSIVVGEETGTLDDMLNTTADRMEYESEQATQGLVTMLEPAIIVLLAVMVGFIIISIIQPIYGSYQSIASMTK
ncbi:MAG: type II secretion system F family protein [Lachnospiraceae bacterium]|nr:type II secretion system F family protein [Lachnospiraceae bacterium]